MNERAAIRTLAERLEWRRMGAKRHLGFGYRGANRIVIHEIVVRHGDRICNVAPLGRQTMSAARSPD
jgi:hypothetical protein